MGSQMSVAQQLASTRSNTLEIKNNRANMEVKNKLAQDVRKLTLSKLKIHKRKDKVAQSNNKDCEKTKKEVFNTPESEKKIVDEKKPALELPKKQVPNQETKTPAPQPERTVTKEDRTPAAACATGTVNTLPPSNQGRSISRGRHSVTSSGRLEKRWTLTDLLNNFGIFVQKKCSHLHNSPSPTEVAMWVRCADRALHLNGWTINSFLLESHVVFSYMLVAFAFENYNIRSLVDAKELVLMCLYVSYTYNANEISYPLRPFLVKPDRAAFWDKCLDISLNASGMMLRLNRDTKYYADTLASLKCIHMYC